MSAHRPGACRHGPRAVLEVDRPELPQPPSGRTPCRAVCDSLALAHFSSLHFNIPRMITYTHLTRRAKVESGLCGQRGAMRDNGRLRVSGDGRGDFTDTRRTSAVCMVVPLPQAETAWRSVRNTGNGGRGRHIYVASASSRITAMEAAETIPLPSPTKRLAKPQGSGVALPLRLPAS